MPSIPEEHIHEIWRTRNFQQLDLVTVEGNSIQVIDPGKYNQHSGPDFSDAIIEIDGLVWHGPIEIHTKASDYYKHLHHQDPAFDNVILHVVYTADVLLDNIPTLALAGYVTRRDLKPVQKHSKILCARHQNERLADFRSKMVQQCANERIHQKAMDWKLILNQLSGNWEYLLYTMTGCALMSNLNRQSMLQLMLLLNVDGLLFKAKLKQKDIESILFAYSGLVPELTLDPHSELLSHSCKLEKAKRTLEPMRRSDWKFMRTRPGNFPTLRLAQFSKVLELKQFTIGNMIQGHSSEYWINTLAVEVPPYWTSHYDFGKPMNEKGTVLSRGSCSTIIINAIAPFLYLYGLESSSLRHVKSAISLVEQCAPEQNRITRLFEKYGFTNRNAWHSQGLLHLDNTYCSKKKCLNCIVGANVLSIS